MIRFELAFHYASFSGFQFKKLKSCSSCRILVIPGISSSLVIMRYISNGKTLVVISCAFKISDIIRS